MGEKRVDWDTNFPMFTVTEVDEEKKTTGAFYTAKETNATVIDSFGPKDAMSGDIFAKFAEVRMSETVKGLGRRNSPSRICTEKPSPGRLNPNPFRLTRPPFCRRSTSTNRVTLSYPSVSSWRTQCTRTPSLTSSLRRGRGLG